MLEIFFTIAGIEQKQVVVLYSKKDLKDFINIPPYPTDDVKEMATIRKLMSTRTKQDVESVANNDEDSFIQSRNI